MTSFLVVFDVDSTLIQDEVIELLAEYAGVRAQVQAITDRAMAGELDFAESLRGRVATLADLPDSVIARAYEQIRITDGAEALISAIHAAGGRVGAVSGGFSQLLTPLADRLKLDFHRANDLDVVGGKLTGRVTGEIIDKSAKARALAEWAASCQLTTSQTVAVGDGANDLEMMAAAGLSIAFNAKPTVREQASLVIDRPNLTELIPVLGL